MRKDLGLIGLIGLVTLAMAWVLWPLFGGIFWGLAFAIVLDPLARRLTAALGGRRALAALVTIAGFVVLIVLPVLLILRAVVIEANGLIAAIQSGRIDLHLLFQTLVQALPAWSQGLLDQAGFGDLAAVQTQTAQALTDWLATNGPLMLSFGMNTAGVFVDLGVTLYLMFFLFRDGDRILARLIAVLPIEDGIMRALCATFVQVVRATVRGDILIALLQGGLGGLGLWALGIHAAMLWTVLMAFVSLFPLFGAALIWGPVSLYLLANGSVWQGALLILYGVLVIGLIDNVARPWLVGQATRMPDYIVLISTLGGIATFGMQGFITGPVVAALFISVWTTLPAKSRP